MKPEKSLTDRLEEADRLVMDVCQRLGLKLLGVPRFSPDGRVIVEIVWADADGEAH
jgi:hypothetical protein